MRAIGAIVAVDLACLGAVVGYLRKMSVQCQGYSSGAGTWQAITVVLESARICKELFDRAVVTPLGVPARIAESRANSVVLQGPLVLVHANFKRHTALLGAVLWGALGSHACTEMYRLVRPDQDKKNRTLFQKITKIAIGLTGGLACGYFVWKRWEPKDLPEIVQIRFLDPQVVTSRLFQRLLSFIPQPRGL
jgi:hypothetical protein